MMCHRCGKIFPDGRRFCPECGLEVFSASTSEVSDSFSFGELLSFNSLSYAGFWRRVAAFFLDRFLLGFINAFLCLCYVLLAGGEWSDEKILTLFLTSVFFGFLLKWLYFTLMESSAMQATVGKALIGIRVTDDQGRKISPLRANARYWAKMLSTLTFGLGYLMAGFTRRKQALHDLIAGTLVVR